MRQPPPESAAATRGLVVVPRQPWRSAYSGRPMERGGGIGGQPEATSDDRLLEIANAAQRDLLDDGWSVAVIRISDVSSPYPVTRRVVFDHPVSIETGYLVSRSASEADVSKFVMSALQRREITAVRGRPRMGVDDRLVRSMRLAIKINRWSVEVTSQVLRMLTDAGQSSSEIAQWVFEAGPPWDDAWSAQGDYRRPDLS